jgi:hypothetical protein
MSKKRTRQEKVLANLKRQLVTKTSVDLPPQAKSERISLSTQTFYQPEFNLPLKLVYFDLTKTLAVTILALILQFALAAYLSHGGWQVINSVLLNKILSFK